MGSVKAAFPLAAISIVLLTGCATSTIPVGETTLFPADRVRYHAVPLESAKVVVIRDTHWYSPDRYRDIVMDDVVVAQMMVGERVDFFAPTGDHVFSAQIPPDRAVGNPMRLPPATVSIVIDAKKTYYLRMGRDENGHVTLRRAFSAEQ